MTDVLSGAVPRTLVAGVEWDEASEAHFRAQYALSLSRTGFTHDSAFQEALWSVEVSLHRRFVAQQMRAAQACQTVDEKKRLMAWWVSQFGSARAADLATLAKHPKFPETAINKWIA